MPFLAPLVFSPAAPARSAQGDLDAAKQRVREAQVELDDASATYSQEWGRTEQLQIEVADFERRLEETKVAIAAQSETVRATAAQLYMRQGSGFSILDEDVGDYLTGTALLGYSSRRDQASLDLLTSLEEDLEIQTADLRARRAEQEAKVEQLAAQKDTLESRLAEAQGAQAALEEEIRLQELERIRNEEEAKKRAAEQARQFVQSLPSGGGGGGSSDDDGGSDSGSDGGGGGSVGWVCPVQGALTFSNDWGQPRAIGGGHIGNDLFAPIGTPNVAVVAGEAVMRGGSTSGNGVRLNGDDGNLYYYFHLSAYEGGSRHVSQGEVIGYTGNTGNASGGAPHTHFEYRPGGGGPSNPYPYLVQVC